MRKFTLLCEIAKQVTAKERLSMAGLYTVSTLFDMCGTGSGENQLPMKLAFGASLLLQVMWPPCPSSCS